MSSLKFHENQPNAWIFGITHEAMGSPAEKLAIKWVEQQLENFKRQYGRMIPATVIVHLEDSEYIPTELPRGADILINCLKAKGVAAFSDFSKFLESSNFEPIQSLTEELYRELRARTFLERYSQIRNAQTGPRYRPLFRSASGLGRKLQTSCEDPPLAAAKEDLLALKYRLATLVAMENMDINTAIESIHLADLHLMRSIERRDWQFSQCLIDDRFMTPEILHIIVRGGLHVHSLKKHLNRAYQISAAEQCLGDPLAEFAVYRKKTGSIADHDDEPSRTLRTLLSGEVSSLLFETKYSSRAKAIADRITDLTPVELVRWFAEYMTLFPFISTHRAESLRALE